MNYPTSPGKRIESKIKDVIPARYGETKIVILPRDPSWMFAYWEVVEDVVRKYENDKWVLRVYDVTGVDFDGTNANSYFDIEINRAADNWYINLPQINRSWICDIGVIKDGKFILIARSNVVHMPRGSVSHLTDEQWGILEKEFERLMEISGIKHIGRSSFDITKLMKERWEEIVSISSLFAASKVPEKAQVEGKEKMDLWLEAHVDVVIYGATDPLARLTVNGESVKMDNEGRFTMRMVFPPGKREFNIESKLGDLKKSITIKLSRQK